MVRKALILGAGSLAAASAALYFFGRSVATEKPKPAAPVGNISDGAKMVEVPDIDLSFMDQVVSNVTNVLQPRGIRNNNPLNIKWSSVNNWLGQTGKDSGGFSIFDKPENGIRAAARILDNYAKRGITTLGDIVKTWAPAEDKNNVEAYTEHVERGVGKSRGVRITRADYLPLLRVMIKHENGKQPYTDAQIIAGINAA